MQNVMPESLRNIKNDWMDIFRETVDQEMFMATYLRALQPDVFSLYKPKIVYAPTGWAEAYGDYKMVGEDTRSKVWKGICEKFSGYVKALSDAKSENQSNKFFLEEMRDYFLKNNMPLQTEKCRQRLLEFDSVLVAA